LIPLLLFGASAAFTLWRNSEVGVLVDLAYVLNIGTRIAAGDIPYAQFPLAQAPLEFVVQGLLIKAFGPHFWVQIAYATILGGLATAITYTIARRLLEGAVAEPQLLAAILAIPLVPLGIYAVVPHPFYDPDACLLILLTIAALFAARDRPTLMRWLVAGALIAVPVFVKQNIGGAFLALTVATLAAEAIARPSARAGFRWCMTGLLVTLGAELLVLQLAVGLANYIRWAWTFAMAGRGVATERIREFADPVVLFPGAALLALALLAQRLAPHARAAAFLLGLLVFGGWALVTPVLSGGGAPLLFPFVLVAACVLALARAARDGIRFDTLLPLVLAATVLGTLQSQGLKGSAFGIFPLLVLALACLVRDLARFVDRPVPIARLTGVAVALLLTASGTLYTVTNRDLLFIDVNAAGPVAHSTFPSLAGLSARGPYIADLDTMLVWARDNIPANDPVVFLPGEDPAFFALGWRPRLPSVYFYDVATPYSPTEVARIADEVGLRWVFVKDRLQLWEEPPLEKAFVAALTDRATLYAQVGPYRVFRR
jgi:hypothetical protein